MRLTCAVEAGQADWIAAKRDRRANGGYEAAQDALDALANALPESTLTAAEMFDLYHSLAVYPLDIQGAADAFRQLYGYGEMYAHVRPYPGFAYDTRAGVWREWWGGIGWRERASVLPEMTGIVAGLCAIEAWRKNDRDSRQADKIEAEYRKLRRQHLGQTVSKAITLAAVQSAVGQWDANENLLGLPDGECLYITPTNPRAGVHPATQEAADYLTRKMAAAPGRRSPLWESLVGGLTGGDTFMESALQVWMAAALLPGNVHHKAHILFGDGNTGKSTFLKTIQHAMGDYAASARSSVFVSEKDNHPAELLPFTQNRLVVLPELPLGALRSDLLKAVTGGDAISVRGMRENPRTATPSATLMFSANELPSIRLVDNALRRRLLIWPCDNAPVKVDLQLGGKLASEEHIGGVVAWIVTGIQKYLRTLHEGLDMPIPDRVRDATETYFQEADNVGQWADACLEEGGETLAANLYASFAAWCAGRGRKPLSEKTFGLWMGRHYERRHTKSGNLYPVSVNNSYPE